MISKCSGDRSTKESSASVISSSASKSRGARRPKKGGKIRAGRWVTRFGLFHSKLYFAMFPLVCLFILSTHYNHCFLSPGEEMALVDHLKGMSLTTGAQKELRSLLVVLTQLGKEDVARQVQLAGDNFEVSQVAAVKLAEDTISTDKMDENAHTLEHYTKMLRAHKPITGETNSWQIKALSPP